MKAFLIAFLWLSLLWGGIVASAQPDVKDFKEIFRLKMSPLTEVLQVDGKLDLSLIHI